ncbi:MAG: hypothetical protein LQ350_007369 [Teloschistes chrysophthalmus]|nr:MAG: hypothetical protein LQ350_007369 [Niorma chrysophthalma]
MVNINKEITRIQDRILALKGFGHGDYSSALDILERWIGDQRERYIATQRNLDGTAAAPNEFEEADQSKVVSPWSLHHDPTRINLELMESPEDSLSGEINDMLNLPEADARIERADSLFISPERLSLDEDGDLLLSETDQPGRPEGDSRVERADSLFISPERLSSDEDGDLLLPETDHPEGNISSAPHTNTYGGTWSDITDNSPIISATNAHLDGVASDASSQARLMVPEILKLDALPAMIEKAQDTFARSRVDFLYGEKVVTVNPDEVNDFFSQFKQDGMLTTSALKPIVSSFAWDTKTLVLHSSYIEVEEAQRAPKRKEPRVWPIANTHGRIIIPSCYEEHWTLFYIDLNNLMV